MAQDDSSYTDYAVRFQRIKIWIGLLLVVLFVTLWAGLGFYLLEARRHTLHNARVEIVNLSRALEENVFRVVGGIDQLLIQARAKYARSPETFDLAAVIKENTALKDIAFQLSIIGPDGRFLASNISPSEPGVDLSGREHFFHHLDPSRDDLFISRPLVGKVSGKKSIQFTRRIVNPDHSFGGVLVVSADPGYFSGYYSALELGERGIIALFRSDGSLLARNDSPEAGNATQSLPPERLRPGGLSTPRLAFETIPSLDSVPRLFHFRPVRDYPITVCAGLSREDVLRGLNRQTVWSLGCGAAFSLVLACFGWVLLRRYSSIVTEDLNTLREHESQVSFLARHDALTGLGNRRFLFERLQHALAVAARGRQRLALLFLDLDHFKAVNDSLGHRHGDELLKDIAAILRASIRSSDTIARFGGDEFIVLIENVERTQDAAVVADKIRHALAQAMEAAPQGPCVSLSIGISCYPEDGCSADELIHRADGAMYRSKNSGGNRVTLCS